MAEARVSAHACKRAGYARTIRGGRSGPSAANALTVSTTVSNTVGATAGAGTAGMGLRMAPNEQQDAQALHFCCTACLPCENVAGLAKAASSSSAWLDMSWCPVAPTALPWWSACSADAAGAALLAVAPPWWFGPQNTMVAAAAPWAGTARTSNQTRSVRISKPIYELYSRPAVCV